MLPDVLLDLPGHLGLRPARLDAARHRFEGLIRQVHRPLDGGQFLGVLHRPHLLYQGRRRQQLGPVGGGHRLHGLGHGLIRGHGEIAGLEAQLLARQPRRAHQ